MSCFVEINDDKFEHLLENNSPEDALRLYIQSSMGQSLYLPVNNRTGDTGIDSILKKWQNQLRILNKQKTSNPDQKAEKEREITLIESQIKDLLEKQDMKTVMDTANIQLGQVERILNNDPTIKDLRKAMTYIAGWEDIVDIFDYEYGSDGEKQLGEITTRTSLLLKKWREIARTKFLAIANNTTGRDIDYKEAFEAMPDIGMLRSYLFDSSVSTVVIEQVLDQWIKENSFDINNEVNTKIKDVDEKIDAIKKVDGKSWYESLLQVRSDGSYTGNLVDEYKQEFYDKAKSLAAEAIEDNKKWKDYWTWMKNNSIKLTIEEIQNNKSDNFSEEELKEAQELLNQYERDKTAYLQELRERLEIEHTSSDGTQDIGLIETIYERESKEWERINSPYLREEYEQAVEKGDKRSNVLSGMKGYKYMLYAKPNNQWKDPKYEKLKSNTQLFDFYNYFKTTVKEYLNYIPHESIQSNYLPEMAKSITEEYVSNGSTAALKYLGDSIIDAFTIDKVGDTEYGNIDEESGKPIRELRSRMLNDKLTTDEKSLNVGNILKEYIRMAAAIKHKGRIEDRVLLAERLLEDVEEQITNPDGTPRRDWTGSPIKISNGLKNTKERVGYLVDTFYGKRKELELISDEMTKGPAEGKHFVGSKLGDAIIQYTQIKGLGLNPFSGITNLFFGLVSNISHAAQGVEYTDKTYFKALSIMLNAVSPLKRNLLTSQALRGKVSALMDKFQVLGDINAANYGAKSIFDKLYIFQKLGEYMNQGNVMVAMMLNTKVQDVEGKEHSLWEAFDDDGNLKDGFSNLEFNDIESSGYKVAGKAAKEFSARVQQTVKYLHGNYDLNSPTRIKKHLWGRALMVFRNWIPNTMLNRFGKEFYDYRLGRVKKGRWRTYASIFKELGAIGTLKTLAKMSVLGKIAGQNVDYLSPEDLANMKENMRELAIAGTLLLMTLMLKGLLIDDDDEEQPILTFFLNSAKRTESDLWFFVSPAAFNHIIKDPLPPLKTVNDFVNVFGAVPDLVLGEDEIEYGRNSGDSNIARKLRAAFPIINQPDKITSLTSNVL